MRCLRDRAIGPATQKRMPAELPCEKVVSMKTSHSPFPLPRKSWSDIWTL